MSTLSKIPPSKSPTTPKRSQLRRSASPSNGDTSVVAPTPGEISSTGFSLSRIARLAGEFKPLSGSEERKLLASRKTKDEKRLALWHHNLRYAGLLTTEAFNRRLPHQICTRDDLESAAFVALWDAAGNFEPQRGTKFISYAKWGINKALSDVLTHSASGLTVPRAAIRILGALKTQEDTGVESKQFSQRRLQKAALYRTAVTSIDYTHLKGDSADVIEGRHALIPGDIDTVKEVETPELSAKLDEMLEKLAGLDPRMPQMLRDYYDFDGRHHTLDTIGKKHGITRERVRQILFQGLRRLRILAQARGIKFQDLLAS